MAMLAILMIVGLFFGLVFAVAVGAAAGAAAGHAGVRHVGGAVLGVAALLFFFLLLAAPSRGVHVAVSETGPWRQPLTVSETPFHQAAWNFPPKVAPFRVAVPQDPPLEVVGSGDWEAPEANVENPLVEHAGPALKVNLGRAAQVAAPPVVGAPAPVAGEGPAAWADAPEGRKPEWVDQNPGRQQGVYSKTVHSGRFSTKDEASQDLTQQVELALREQLTWMGLAVPAEWIPRPELVRSAVAAVWCEPLPSERLGTTVYRLHAQTRFPEHVLTAAASDVRRQIGRERSLGVRSLGLWVLGGLGFLWLGARGCRCRTARPWPPAA